MKMTVDRSKKTALATLAKLTLEHFYPAYSTKRNSWMPLHSIHNIAYQMRLMQDIRNAILEDRFSEFIKDFMKKYFSGKGSGAVVDDPDEEQAKSADPGKMKRDGYPVWVLNAWSLWAFLCFK